MDFDQTYINYCVWFLLKSVVLNHDVKIHTQCLSYVSELKHEILGDTHYILFCYYRIIKTIHFVANES